MHDNARAHSAIVTRDYLEQNYINTMEWPPMSPDLNPIEHLWDEIQRRINNDNERPNNAIELRDAIIRAWQTIPRRFINRLIQSMNRRCEEVVNANGGHTRY